jgi:TolA-binding protein
MALNPIDGYPDFQKDESSGAVLNTNNNALDAYKKQKRALSKVGELEQKVSDLTQQLDQMQSLLMQIYEKVAK